MAISREDNTLEANQANTSNISDIVSDIFTLQINSIPSEAEDKLRQVETIPGFWTVYLDEIGKLLDKKNYTYCEELLQRTLDFLEKSPDVMSSDERTRFVMYQAETSLSVNDLGKACHFACQAYEEDQQKCYPIYDRCLRELEKEIFTTSTAELKRYHKSMNGLWAIIDNLDEQYPENDRVSVIHCMYLAKLCPPISGFSLYKKLSLKNGEFWSIYLQITKDLLDQHAFKAANDLLLNMCEYIKWFNRENISASLPVTPAESIQLYLYIAEAQLGLGNSKLACDHAAMALACDPVDRLANAMYDRCIAENERSGITQLKFDPKKNISLFFMAARNPFTAYRVNGGLSASDRAQVLGGTREVPRESLDETRSINKTLELVKSKELVSRPGSGTFYSTLQKTGSTLHLPTTNGQPDQEPVDSSRTLPYEHHCILKSKSAP